MDAPRTTVSEALAGGRLRIDLAALAANWRALAKRAAPAECAAVVKADAYGLGIERAVPALVAAGCRTFFVALPGEGVRVRAAAPGAAVYVLNGLFADGLDALRRHRLRPVLGTMEDVRRLADSAPMPAALHIDTGMTRLGLSVAEAERLAGDPLRDRLDLRVVMTHFACADERGHPMTDRQREAFRHVANLFPGVPRSVGNSAATLVAGGNGMDLVRPGVALYGAEAVDDPPLQTVVTLEGRIVQLREAAAGETVGYGATRTLARPSRVAIVSVGYADGFPRAAGDGVPLRAVVPKAHGWLCGRTVPIVGRVSMDLTAYDVTDVADAREGDWLEMFGPHVPVDDVARAAGTIGYELLTGLSRRVARTYIEPSRAEA